MASKNSSNQNYDRSSRSVAYGTSDVRRQDSGLRVVSPREKARVATFRPDNSDIDQNVRSVQTAARMLGGVVESVVKKQRETKAREAKLVSAPLLADMEAKHYEWSTLSPEEYEANMSDFIDASSSAGGDSFSNDQVRNTLINGFVELRIGRNAEERQKEVRDVRKAGRLGEALPEGTKTPEAITQYAEGRAKFLADKYRTAKRELPPTSSPDYGRLHGELIATINEDIGEDEDTLLAFNAATRNERDTELRQYALAQHDRATNQGFREAASQLGADIDAGVNSEYSVAITQGEADRSVGKAEEYQASTQLWMEENQANLRGRITDDIEKLQTEYNLDPNKAWDRMADILEERYASRGIDPSSLLPTNGSATRDIRIKELQDTASVRYGEYLDEVRNREESRKNVGRQTTRDQIKKFNEERHGAVLDATSRGIPTNTVIEADRAAREKAADRFFNIEDYPDFDKYNQARLAFINGDGYKELNETVGIELERKIAAGVSRAELEEYADANYRVYDRTAAQAQIDRKFSKEAKGLGLAEAQGTAEVEEALLGVSAIGVDDLTGAPSPESVTLVNTISLEYDKAKLAFIQGQPDAKPEDFREWHDKKLPELMNRYLTPDQQTAIQKSNKQGRGKAKVAAERMDDLAYSQHVASLPDSDKAVIKGATTLRDQWQADADGGALGRTDLTPEQQAKEYTDMVEGLSELNDEEARQSEIELFNDHNKTPEENEAFRQKLAADVAERRYDIPRLESDISRKTGAPTARVYSSIVTPILEPETIPVSKQGYRKDRQVMAQRHPRDILATKMAQSLDHLFDYPTSRRYAEEYLDHVQDTKDAGAAAGLSKLFGKLSAGEEKKAAMEAIVLWSDRKNENSKSNQTGEEDFGLDY